MDSVIDYRRLVKPIQDSTLRAELAQLSVDEFVVSDKCHNLEERSGPIAAFRGRCTEYLSPLLSDLDRLPYFYILNGNTDYIHQIVNLAQNIDYAPDDYRYYDIARKSFKAQRSSSGEAEYIFSYPSWQMGGSENWIRAQTKSAAKHMDVAYFALTKDPQKVSVADLDTVGVSFSKTLAMPYNRLSVLYSRKKIAHLQLMQAVGHVNLSALAIAIRLMNLVGENFWIDNYWENYLELCRAKNWQATHCLLFAYTSEGERVSTAEYLRL